MANFQEAIKTDKDLQAKVAAAVKQVAEDHGHTIDAKAYSTEAKAGLGCVSVGFSVVCTA